MRRLRISSSPSQISSSPSKFCKHLMWTIDVLELPCPIQSHWSHLNLQIHCRGYTRPVAGAHQPPVPTLSTTVDSREREHFHRCRTFCWAVLLRISQFLWCLSTMVQVFKAIFVCFLYTHGHNTSGFQY